MSSDTYERKMIITPEKAKEILDKFADDMPRKIAWGTIWGYATIMKNNKWVPYHPCGLIFDDKGKLVDGFHRLNAVVLSNISIPFKISYNWKRNDILESVDKGRTRSICDSLDMVFGEKMQYRHNVPSIAKRIVAIAMGDEKKNTVYSTKLVYDLYKNEIQEVMKHCDFQKRLSISTVLSALVLGAKINLDKTIDFETKYFSGEGIYKEEPVFRMRTFMMNEDRVLLKDKRRLAFRLCLTALKYHFEGKKMRRMAEEDNIYQWFIKGQEKEINAIRKHLQLNGA